jgi:nitrogen fixation/metabolism regulation signal transduction histidine kinase
MNIVMHVAGVRMPNRRSCSPTVRLPQAWRGLGLAIVKQIADAHGAHIDLGTSPEGGLRATVAFPLVPV